MKYVFTALIAVVAVVLLAAPATADWDETQFAKWVQMPAVDPNDWGMNVLASTIGWQEWPVGSGNWAPVQKVLADDFPCKETGYITDIHIWGSWLGDIFPYDQSAGGVADPGNVMFKLSIHHDIPADEATDYSQPVLPAEWERIVAPSQVRLWAPSDEDFWDPNSNEVMGMDTKVFQYNFLFDEADAFLQQGTPTDPMTYWLNVTAMPFSDDATFGWKTSREHWNDDAVYWDEYPDGTWTDPQELRDWRPGSLFYGQSLDMAFVITPEPGTWAMLLGAGLIGLAAYARRRRKS